MVFIDKTVYLFIYVLLFSSSLISRFNVMKYISSLKLDGIMIYVEHIVICLL